MADIARRGNAPPSARLGRRHVQFDLSRLFGGGRAGDAWGVPPDLQQQLRQRYRDAANGELNLGRFSRAAYIYAHLLGDFAAAAAALKRGRRFREAATLYKEKLRNPLEAADCLSEGGALVEAIELYESLQMHESAAGLYDRLGQPDAAAASYRRTVDQLVAQRQVVEAARLLETKLARPLEALDLLSATWPDDDAAGNCLVAWFSLCGRCNEPARAMQRLDALAAEPPAGSPGVTLVQKLATVAVDYPDFSVQHRAGDVVRVLAGARLAATDPMQRQQLVHSVVSLAPADRLLARDGERFLSRQAPRPLPVPIPVKGVSPRLDRFFQLPGMRVWKSAVLIPGGFLAHGVSVDGAEQTLVRGTWNGKIDANSFRGGKEGPYVLLGGSGDSAPLLGSLGLSDHSATRIRFRSNDLFSRELNVMTPIGDDPNCVGICRDEHNNVCRLRAAGERSPFISMSDQDGSLLSTYDLVFDETRLLNLIPQMIVIRRGHLFTAAGKQVVRFDLNTKRSDSFEMPSVVQRLSASAPFTAMRLIIGLEWGCAIMNDAGSFQWVARTLPQPVGMFTPDGALVVVGGESGQILQRNTRGEFSFLSDFSIEGTPVSLLAADAGRFAVFNAEGVVKVFRMAL